MKNRQRIAALTLCLAAALPAAAQSQRAVPLGTEPQWGECRQLFWEQRYNAALNVLQQIDETALPFASQQEWDYMRAAATFEVEAAQGAPLLAQHLQLYPRSVYRNSVLAMQGAAAYFAGDYAAAVDHFAQCDLDELAGPQRDRAALYYALALFECGETQRPYLMLNVLEQTSSLYDDEAIFFRACIDFYNDKINAAQAAFRDVEQSPRFSHIVPYYMGAIELRRGEYDKAESRARHFIAQNSGTPHAVRMQQILGGALFGQQRYNEALPLLEQHIEATPLPQRVALYQLGMSRYLTGNTQGATEPLEQVTRFSTEDALSQNAYLHLGLAQLARGNRQAARLAFEQAARNDYSKSVKEEAMYNYALCLHQEGYSPFAESVKVFEKFLNEFPDSKYAPQVDNQLVDVYLNTRNYEVALASIEKIKRPGTPILQAKQRILYRLGVQAFINNDMQAAVDRFTRSIELGQYNAQTRLDSYNWRGEALYRLKRYDEAGRDFATVANASPAGSNATVYYSLGYVEFSKKNYDSALRHFTRFTQGTELDQRLCADAYNRMGDCNFYRRSYDAAVQNYQQAWGIHTAAADYAMYRAAQVLGIQDNYARKAELLSNLLATYPRSSYAEAATYELARTYVELEDYKMALETFQSLIRNHPDGALARKASVEIASIYYQKMDYKKAVAAYKKVIEKYPYSEEAQVAAQDLKNIYVESGDIEGYLKYAAKTQGMPTIQADERDQLTYSAAERLYLRGDTEAARQSFAAYLQKYPQGTHQFDARYYLGLIAYNQGDKAQARSHFAPLLSYPDNRYNEEVLALSAQMDYDDKNYAQAMQHYEALALKTADAEKRLIAQMNTLRCAYLLKEGKKVVEQAALLLQNAALSQQWESEVYYDRANALCWLNREGEALADFRRLAADTRTRQGAEAKYRVAQILYDNKEYAQAEAEVQSYIEASTPHTYWLARAFVLLADVYIAQDKPAEARQYLLSLKNNYTETDDIAGRIQQRLEKLDAAQNR